MGSQRGDGTGEQCPDSPTDERLHSWKEVAAYLKRGARTVQRWEREEGLPIRRLQHDKLGSIYGYKSELDAWWAAREAKGENAPAKTADPEPSVAVMQFTDLSPERDQTHFCNGLADEILHALGHVRGLRTASRVARQPGRESGVRALLEGSVRKFSGQLRITVQLLEANSGFQLWSERFDRLDGNILDVQDEVATQVSRAVASVLQAGSPQSEAAQLVPNERAREFYQRGRDHFYRFSPAAMEFAIQLFVRAIEIDPACSLAYAGLADCWSFTYLCAGRSDALREQADWASLRALEMNPRSAQSHVSRGLALSLFGRNQEAGQAFESAARLDPGLFDAHFFRARHFFTQGELEEAAASYAKAIDTRPADYQAPLLCAQVYSDLGRTQEAAAIRVRGVRAAEEHLKWNPDDARALSLAASGLAASGDRARGRQFVERALAMRPEDPVLLYNAACTFALMGMIESAFDLLERAAAAGFQHKEWFRRDSNLDPLKQHERFSEILQRIP